jgi:hypothetical protein
VIDERRREGGLHHRELVPERMHELAGLRRLVDQRWKAPNARPACRTNFVLANFVVEVVPDELEEAGGAEEDELELPHPATTGSSAPRTATSMIRRGFTTASTVAAA